MSEKPATFGAMAQSIIESEGETFGNLVLNVMKHFEQDDPRRIFWEWLIDNAGNVENACRELGLEPPGEGYDLVGRLQKIVTPKLTGGKEYKNEL